MFWQGFRIGNHIWSALSPAVSPLKVESLFSGLIETILFIFIHHISCWITPKIFQNDQEVEFINPQYRHKYCKIPKRWITGKKLQNEEETQVFPQKKHYQNMNQLRMSQGRTGKISVSMGSTETIVWNRYSLQVPAMVRTNDYTNEKNKL